MTRTRSASETGPDLEVTAREAGAGGKTNSSRRGRDGASRNADDDDDDATTSNATQFHQTDPRLKKKELSFPEQIRVCSSGGF